MAVRIQIRRDTTANWASSNPVLADGELGVDSDLDLLKVGDGIQSWTALPFINPASRVKADGTHPGFVVRTIAAGSITIDSSVRTVTVSNEAAAASDELTTMLGGARGQIVTVHPSANANDLIIDTGGGTGGFRLTTTVDLTLDAARSSVTFRHDGTNWIETTRAIFPAA